MVDIKELKNLTSTFSLLYVEDDKEIAKSFISYLSKFFKEVIYAENGEQGLDLYKQQNFEFVLTDINMPIMDGLELSRQIKEINKNQNIIIISAYADTENFLSSIKLGIDGYIIKPVNYSDMNNLLYKIATNLRTSYENEINIEQQQMLYKQISKNNSQLKEYTKMLDKVAIVSKGDLSGKITYVNDIFCEVSGYSRDELIGKSHNIIRHQDMSKSVYSELWEEIQKGKVWRGSIKNKKKDGSPYFVYVTIIPLFDDISENIKEYISIRFITTEEENKKRDFQKKVMIEYQEIKKSSLNANKNVEQLLKHINQLKGELSLREEKQKKLKLKNSEQLGQIDFYEKEIIKKEKSVKKTIDYATNHSKNITESYQKAILKIELQNKKIIELEKDNKNKKIKLIDLDTDLEEQRNIITDLRDTIKNIDNKKETSKNSLWN